MSQQQPLLYPLDRFYEPAGALLPPARQLSGEEVPEPYNRLLVHERDMTPTLEAFHGERIHLRVLARRQEGDAYARQVVLTLDDSNRPVEYGAIVIHLQHFPSPARDLILEEYCPLGTILATFRITHTSRPRAFLSVTPDEHIHDALCLGEPCTLYGRRNVLIDTDENALADILEILPPSRSEVESPMRIIQLTPGTGSFYCGTCLRDNALVAELRRQGHDALLVPLYLPPALD
jgi:chorismate-pyruvate lyase